MLCCFPNSCIKWSLAFQDAVDIVQDIMNAEAASRKLIEEAYARGSSDNITCVVVRFENSGQHWFKVLFPSKLVMFVKKLLFSYIKWITFLSLQVLIKVKRTTQGDYGHFKLLCFLVAVRFKVVVLFGDLILCWSRLLLRFCDSKVSASLICLYNSNLDGVTWYQTSTLRTALASQLVLRIDWGWIISFINGPYV